MRQPASVILLAAVLGLLCVVVLLTRSQSGRGEVEVSAGARYEQAPAQPAGELPAGAGPSRTGGHSVDASPQQRPEFSGDDEAARLPTPVIVYYFHRTLRCFACLQIEMLARQAVEQRFPAEIAAGHLVWQVVNIEEPGNEHFEEEYALFGPALILLRLQGGEWTVLEEVWPLLEEPGAFAEYVENEIHEWLYNWNQPQHSGTQW